MIINGGTKQSGSIFRRFLLKIPVGLRPTPQERAYSNTQLRRIDDPEERDNQMLINQFHKNLPEYYDSMYMDGDPPEQIMEAHHRSMVKKHYAD